MNQDIYAIVSEYIERYAIQPNGYIFESRQGLKGYPITRQQAWRVIKQLADEAVIKYPVACHSLRKSYGRWYWDETHDLLTTQKLLMHESAAETMLYIMLEPSDIQEVRESINHTEKWG